MEEKDSHNLETQHKKAVEKLSGLPETEKPFVSSMLDLQNQRNTLHLEFLSKLRELEFKYDQKYFPLYETRSEITKTLSEFWLKVLENNPLTRTMIFEQDIPLLKHLTEIKYKTEEKSDNFTLEFYFSENQFIKNSVLTKKYIVNDDDPEKAEGCEIQWKGKNLTQKVKKMKKKGKKAGTKIEEVPSFFSFFKTITADDEEQEENSEEDVFPGDLIDEDYEIGCEIRDEIVPNALLYYLGVRGEPEEDDEDDEEEEEEHGKKGDKKAKPKKVDGSGNEKAECKPQ